jgi:ferritin-like metal-binding protein YciE
VAKTNTESIRELEQGFATLSERVDNLRQDIERSEERTSQRIERLEKALEEVERRQWQLMLAFIGAILSLAVGLTLALVRR